MIVLHVLLQVLGWIFGVILLLGLFTFIALMFGGSATRNPWGPRPKRRRRIVYEVDEVTGEERRIR